MEVMILGLVLALVTAFFALWWSKIKIQSPQLTSVKPIEPRPVAEKIPQPSVSWKTRLSDGMSRARQDVWGKLLSVVGKDHQSFEEAEEILHTADLPPALVEELIEALRQHKGGIQDEQTLKNVLRDFLRAKLLPLHQGQTDRLVLGGDKPKVIMVVGVNGAGKTTTIGKLAARLREKNAKVLVGACDTFRAAAVDQLQVWCDRAGADIVRAKDGADPSGVAYDTVSKAKSDQYDFCLVDTAGRLHTASGLMDELAKTKKVMGKVAPHYPHEVWLVIDAITGQNALRQAQEFHKTLGLTGVVFTKCDGSAKAGSAIAIVQQLQVPIVYIGVGEGVDDLQPFDSEEYISALLGISSTQP